MMTLLAAVWTGAVALAGEPILMPDFTAATPSEVALSAMLTELAFEELEKDGHLLIPSSAASTVVGDIIERCADRQGCPYAPLQQLPTRFAIVVRLGRNGEELEAAVDFYEQADPTPFDSTVIAVEPGNEVAFARALRGETSRLLDLLGPAPSDDLVAAARLIEGGPPSPPPAERAPTPPGRTARASKIRRGTSRPLRSGVPSAASWAASPRAAW